MTRVLPLLCHFNRHRWVNRGLTVDGEFRLQCRCGAVSLRRPMGTTGTSKA